MDRIRKIWNAVTSRTCMAIVALFSVVFALYQTFIYEKRGDMILVVNSLSKVYDIHRELGELDVFYAGESLRASKKVLWSLTITISNSGNAEIRKSDFDSGSPIALEISNAEIVGSPNYVASNDYLKTNFHVSTSEKQAQIAPVTWEVGDNVHLSLVLLADEGVEPSLKTSGKVVGHRLPPELKTFDSSEPDAEVSLLRDLFVSSHALTQPLRLMAYGIVFLLLVVGLAVLSLSTNELVEKISDTKNKQLRVKNALRFAAHISHEDIRKAATDAYVDIGPGALRHLRDGIAEAASIHAIQSKLTGLEERHQQFVPQASYFFLESAKVRDLPVEILETALSELNDIVDQYAKKVEKEKFIKDAISIDGNPIEQRQWDA